MLIVMEGVIAIFMMLRFPSEIGSAFLFGYSRVRLLIASGVAFISFIIFVAGVSIILKASWWQKLANRILQFLSMPIRLFIVIAIGFTIILGISGLQFLSLSPAANEAVILKSILQRYGVVLLWIQLVIMELGILLWIDLRDHFRGHFTPLRLSVLFSIFTILFFAVIKLYAFFMWEIRFRGIEDFIFLPAITFLVWAWIHQKYHSAQWYPRISNIFLSISIGIVVITVYRLTSHWVDWRFTPSKAYWHELADAFLHGRLYLVNPETTHDLTLFKGNWYIPNPPLPALILMPFVAMQGVEHINTIHFSIACGAVTTVIIFWLLESAAKQGLFSISRNANLWITAVFAFGTCFWWLSVMGRVWFLSQILTVLFTALAALLAVCKKSPWWVGLSLGAAILSRPNVFTIWPFLLGIAVYLQQRDKNEVQWGRMFAWSVQSAIPVCLAVGGLLFYNYIRFEDFFDFGYVTINSSGWIMESVRTYGMFHPHFVQSNFSMMFLNHPRIYSTNGCISLSASRDGYNMLVMTPTLLYAVRRFQKNWWMLGAWISVLLSIGLLLFYHNNGAWQLGYRYLMDFIVPVLFLIAAGVGSKPSWFFKLLVTASVFSNLAGILWWFEKWWC
jgi:hypothetical protein